MLSFMQNRSCRFLILPLFPDEILMLRILHQLCKVLFSNYANRFLLVFSSSYAGSRLHLLSEGCALVWGMFVRGCARRDLC